jgi:hypothetical protein
MEFNNDEILNDKDSYSNKNEGKPKAWKVEGDSNLNEHDLERRLFAGSTEKKPIMEGLGMGGDHFGRNNVTPAGDDKNNPSRYGGYTNAYFARTEPMEEHPEDNNFKTGTQEGRPDYDRAQPYAKITGETPKPEKMERGNGENDRPHKGNTYCEGTVDNENEPNIPGPNELPDQQKVGEDIDEDEREHIET